MQRVDDTQFAEDKSHWYGRAVKNFAKRGVNIAINSIKSTISKD